MLKDAINVLISLKSKGLSHMDIKPCNILIIKGVIIRKLNKIV